MTASRPSYPRLVSAALCLVACAVAIAGAQTPIPRGANGRAVGGDGTAATGDEIGLQALELIQKLVTDFYPTVMQGASPINRITFVLDADGNYVTSVAWTDTAMLRRPTVEAKRQFASVRAVVGAGVRGGGGRRVPAAGTSGVDDFGTLGFPNITSDVVMSTQSAESFAPNALSVFVIRLKK